LEDKFDEKLEKTVNFRSLENVILVFEEKKV
jgi:hypothetical protein